MMMTLAMRSVFSIQCSQGDPFLFCICGCFKTSLWCLFSWMHQGSLLFCVVGVLDAVVASVSVFFESGALGLVVDSDVRCRCFLFELVSEHFFNFLDLVCF